MTEREQEVFVLAFALGARWHKDRIESGEREAMFETPGEFSKLALPAAQKALDNFRGADMPA